MRKKLAVLLVLVAAFATYVVRADQLQINSYEVCRRAVAAIKPNSVAVSYCSECDSQYVDVWRVRRAVVVATGKDQYEVAVFGPKLYRSTERFSRGAYYEPVEYRRVYADSENARWFLQSIDLAYFYVPQNGRFRVLGKQLNLPAEVAVETIKLPQAVSDAINEEYAASR